VGQLLFCKTSSTGNHQRSRGNGRRWTGLNACCSNGDRGFQMGRGGFVRDLAMASPKEQIRESIERLPDDCTLEDVQYHLYVQQKVERGLDDVRRDRVLSQQEVKRRMAQWIDTSKVDPGSASRPRSRCRIHGFPLRCCVSDYENSRRRSIPFVAFPARTTSARAGRPPCARTHWPVLTSSSTGSKRIVYGSLPWLMDGGTLAPCGRSGTPTVSSR
jgi:hypothetical protein